MKTGLYLKVTEYFWNSFKKITNTYSYFTVTDFGNGYIKCFWEINSIDNLRIELSKSSFYAIRIFDISNNRNKNISTCIMKEIQVSKYQSSVAFDIPINKGMYCFEFGYRKKNGEWRKIACKNLNLGYRIKKVFRSYDNDDWFEAQTRKEKIYLNSHEEAYKLSLNNSIGGSESIIYDINNT